MDLTPFKQWIYRKKNKNYRLQINDYSQELRSALDEDIRQKLYQLRRKAVEVHINEDSLQLTTSEEQKDIKNKFIDGIILERASIPQAKLNERVEFIHKKSKKRVAKGRILNIDRQHVKIKFNHKFEIKSASGETDQQNNDDNQEQNNDSDNADLKYDYLVKFNEQHIIDKRRQIDRSLRKLKGLSRSLPIHKCLLGQYSDWNNTKHNRARVVGLDGLPSPRGKQQTMAITKAMKNRISLIEGVAGSGKTLVAANIACSSARLRRHKVLLCSPIQATVDKLTKMLQQAEGIRVVQLAPAIGENQSTAKRDCSLDSLVEDRVYSLGWSSYRRFSSPNRVKDAELHERALRLVRVCSPWLRRKFERQILAESDVVCCTIEQASSLKLADVRFNMLIIDDAQMASEVECLVPMMLKGIKQVSLLSDMRRDIRLSRSISPTSDERSDGQASWKTNSSVGDEVQLKATRKGRKNSDYKYKKSLRQANRVVEIDHLEPGGLFERWLSMGLAAVAMKYQYRMHKKLAAFANHHFYMSRLRTETISNDQLTQRIRNDLLISDENFDWLPKRECLTAIFDTLATSNNSIPDMVSDLIKKLTVKENIPKSRIGVITNNPSVSSLIYHTQDDVRHETTNEFIGQERDFIILSCIECPANDSDKIQLIQVNNSNSCDFLKSDTALNVALTRARLGLFIVADLRNLLDDNQDSQASSLKDDQHEDYCTSWRRLVKYYRKNELVI